MSVMTPGPLEPGPPLAVCPQNVMDRLAMLAMAVGTAVTAANRKVAAVIDTEQKIVMLNVTVSGRVTTVPPVGETMVLPVGHVVVIKI